jgi:hypothetical protein
MTTLRKELWQRIVDSRFLTGFGIVVLMFASGLAISSFAQAQGVTYTFASTSDINALQQQINALNNRVAALESRIVALQNAPSQVTYTTYPATPTHPVTQPTIPNTGTGGASYGPAVIDQNGGTYAGGFDIYFTGRGFQPYEQVLVMRGGTTVGHTNADAGGNISSSGVFLPYGTNTFTFVGQTSGASVFAVVTGVRNVVSGAI